MDWNEIDGKERTNPLIGSRILVFTPEWGSIRYRVCDADDLPRLSDATHWANLEPPKEYWDKP
jgi:hypothetical protein